MQTGGTLARSHASYAPCVASLRVLVGWTSDVAAPTVKQATGSKAEARVFAGVSLKF